MSNNLCIFGEVLFDHLPDGRRVLGGAPFNVAWHLQAFGEHPLMISRVGNDGEGDEVKAAMQRWGLDPDGLQTDNDLPTGKVQITIEQGEPNYDIVYPAAWDAIEPAIQPQNCRLLYHGSLALRSERSRESWKELRSGAIETVFVDVNLRPPWYGRDRVLQALTGAHWVKLNGNEMEQLAPGHGTKQQRARAFIIKYGLDGLILTSGAEGAAVATASGEYLETRPSRGIVVKDTIGAGDSLTAVMILGLMREWPLQTTLDRAQSFASAIVQSRGATVDDPAFYKKFLDAWSQDTFNASGNDS